MKKALLSTLLFCLLLQFPDQLSAQYQKGKVRLLSGETLPGYIQLDTEVDMRRRIQFKTNLSTSVYETYSPNEIAGFSFDQGAKFDAIDTYFKQEQVVYKEKYFAKLVAQGTIDLYLLQNDLEESGFVFYARKDGRLHRLNQERIDVHPHGYILRNYYQGVLNALTYDCRKRLGDIQYVPFSRKEIVETIDNYNACQDPEYEPLVNSYKVDKEKRYFFEFFAGPLIGKRNFGTIFGADRMIEREVFGMVGIAIQSDIYKPSLSRKVLLHNSLEAYKWITLEESGIIPPPLMSLAFNMSAHYIFDENARIKFFTRLGGTFVVDIGNGILPRPGISLGIGAYFPTGGRLGLQLSTVTILGTEGITSWRLGYAIPLGMVRK